MPAGPRAWGGQPGRWPARQQPTYQPAPSQPCPALERPEPTSPSDGPLDGSGRKSQRGIWLRAPPGGRRGSGRCFSFCLPAGPHSAALRRSSSPWRDSRKFKVKGLEQLALCKWRCPAFLRREVLWGEVEPPQGRSEWQPSLSAPGGRRESGSLELWTLASGPSSWPLPGLP